MILDIRYDGLKTKVVTGALAASGNIPGIDFIVTGINIWSVGGTCTITSDFITGDITVLANMTFGLDFPAPIQSPVFAVVVGAGATLNYTVTGVEV